MKKSTGHRTSHTRNKKRDEGIPWDHKIPQGEVHELYGDEAAAQWIAAHAMQLRTPEERAYAETVAAPLS